MDIGKHMTKNRLPGYGSRFFLYNLIVRILSCFFGCNEFDRMNDDK